MLTSLLVAFALEDTAVPAALPIECSAREDRVVVTVDGKPFTEYRFKGDTKPHLYPIFAPSGLHATRRWPAEEVAGEERDHPHHRGLWFAHGAVNGHDFWSGEGGKSKIVVTEVVTAKGDTIQVRQDWVHGEVVVLREQRKMSFSATANTRIIDFEITLTATEGDLTFGDTKEGTFALRLAETLRLAGPRAEGTAWNSEGIMGAEIWGKRASFVAYAGPLVDGDRREMTTVAMFTRRGGTRATTGSSRRTRSACTTSRRSPREPAT
jgi:Methane oxygenase PmoA